MMHSVQSLLEFFLSCPSKIKKLLAIFSFLIATCFQIYELAAG